MAAGSHIFTPFRALGFCSNHVPLSLCVKNRSSHVATAIGKAFHVYECDKLHLVSISPLQSDDITCIVHDGTHTFIAVGKLIKEFNLGKEVATYEGHGGCVHTLLLLGQQLVAIDNQNCLKVWNRKPREIYTEIQFDDTFTVSSIYHPSTYLNKIVCGSQQGSLQLWNIRTNQLIYVYSGWNSPVLTLVQSTALDIVGVGLQDGRVILHNVHLDESVMTFKQEWGPVTSLSFRTDGINTLISTSPSGNIAVWDLDDKRLCSILYDAHLSGISGTAFFPQQPLLITNGSDNAIKIWIFDQSDGSARLLKERCGHSAPPTLIRFHPTSGRIIFSAGLDQSIRVVALHRQTISRELSQGAVIKKGQGIKRKLPPIIDFAFEPCHDADWDSMVTVHMNCTTSYTWNVMNYSIGKHALRLERPSSNPLCCCISGCGHFIILGTSTGQIEIYNIQSGLHRGQLQDSCNKAHSGPVRGVVINALSTTVISGGADKTVKIWSFQGRSLIHTIILSSSVTKLFLHRENGLVGVACDNFWIVVIDEETRRIVRHFKGHNGRITDIVISYDGRWLISSSVDCTIMTWDLPTGQCIDIFKSDTPVSSMTLSNTGEFLATSHVDEVGIFLWSNKTLYSTVSLCPLSPDYIPSIVQLPSTADISTVVNDSILQEVPKKTGPLSHGLVTLSTLPKSQWQSLQCLNIIKERNKPKEPVKPVKPAPFFLPTQPGIQLKFIPAPDIIPSNEKYQSKLLTMKSSSSFQQCLSDCLQTQDFTPFMSLLKTLGPASVDLEFQMLDDKLVPGLVQFLLNQLKSLENYELVQSYIHLLLKYRADILCSDGQCKHLLEHLLKEHQMKWKQLFSEFNYCTTLLNYCKSATV